MSTESTATRRSSSQAEPRREKTFVTRTLPWLAAGAALLVFIVTLNPWVSLLSLGDIARISGWTWIPETTKPLFWLVTLPFKALPASAVPLAANLFTAVCAALTLGLLARSVALLPHDRTEEQRIREKHPDALLTIRWTWVPPVLAVIMCGLQLTFWEHATVLSAEMFDLLVFAYAIRCLLEFRRDGRQSWLSTASLVYAAGMANNWAMVGFFPFFMVALVWIKGLSFFNVGFLLRMFLWGLAGLLLYLLLPLVWAMSDSQMTFWQALRENLGQQKNILKQLTQFHVLFSADRPLWILAIPSLLPLLLIGVRWPSYVGDTSKLGMAISAFTFHLVHGLLFGYCIWIALDPPMSPRNHVGLSALTLYYLGALSIGYLAGYFLLIFGTKPAGRLRTASSAMRLASKPVLVMVVVGAVAGPLLLVSKNIGAIRAVNGPMLRQYADTLAGALPSNSVGLSDDPARLWLAQAAAAQGPKKDAYIWVLTGGNPSALQTPDYHRYLKSIHGARWPVNLPKTTTDQFLDHIQLLKVMQNLTLSNSIYYLHPSFGYYFEMFYPEPHGMVNRLVRYPTNSLLAPLSGESLIADNLAFWAKIADQRLPMIAQAVSQTNDANQAGFAAPILKKLRVQAERNSTAAYVGAAYSQGLTFWGVELQKGGKLEEAEQAFRHAVAMNPRNEVAAVNLDCNRKLQTGEETYVQVSKAVTENLEIHGSKAWEYLMNANGPFDEPNICFEQGKVFFESGNILQSGQQFARAGELAPENLEARLSLALVYSKVGMPEKTLECVRNIRLDPALKTHRETNVLSILRMELLAHVTRQDVSSAEKAIAAALKAEPNDQGILETGAAVYLALGSYSNALPLLNSRLEIAPDHPLVLAEKGFTCFQLGMLPQAVEALSRSLSLQTNTTEELYYQTVFNRAQVLKQSERYEEAKRDFEALHQDWPTHAAVHLGLGDIAYQKKESSDAIKHYELFLANVPSTNTAEATNVFVRLAELKDASR